MTKQSNGGGGGGTVLYVALLIIGLIVGGAAVYIYLGSKSSGPVLETRVGVTKEKKIKYWQAPMDPTYIRDEPGKSPMGMDLKPVYEGDGEVLEPGTVKIDPVTTQNIGVRTAVVEKRRLTRIIRSAGRVDYDEQKVYHVNTKIEGWVEKLYVDFTGQEVKKDDYLLEVYSPKLVATQEEYLLARRYAKSSNATGELADDGESVPNLARKRLELWDVPAHQIRELEESGQVKKTIHIHSPASGIVVNKMVQEGMFVKPGMKLYTIANLSRVWVYADLYEYEFAWVKEGQEAEMELAAYPGEKFKGKVAFINPFMEPKTRTVKVRLEFDNPHGKLKPDMFANVTFFSKMKGDVVAIPSEAVLLSGERSVVIVSRGEGKFTPKGVTLGVEAGGFYEVKEGLKEGEEVVTSAQFLIDSESRLSEAISKMLELKKEDKDSKEMDSSGMKEMNPSEMKGMDHSGMKEMDSSGMKEMNSSEMKGMDNSGMKEMDHSGMKEMNPSEMKGMDNSKMKEMDHSGMKEMNPSEMKGMDNSKMKEMDHSGMKEMDHSGMKEMDHSNMDGMNHKGMDHD